MQWRTGHQFNLSGHPAVVTGQNSDWVADRDADCRKTLARDGTVDDRGEIDAAVDGFNPRQAIELLHY